MEQTLKETIYPIILAVPDTDRGLKGREKVRSLSYHARTALKMSARYTGVYLGRLIKNAAGAPVPTDGIFWSISHKRVYVAGVVSKSTVGIDIETIKPVSNALYQKIAEKEEWSLSHGSRHLLFFRFWTAKEAVLKAGGVGMADLSKCKIVRIIDPVKLIVDYRNQEWEIVHLFFHGHVAAVVGNNRNVRWQIL